MSAIVIYESVYGNTRAAAEAIAEGLGDAGVFPVHEAPDHVRDHELVVIGGPTHMHGMATSRSRHAAVEALQEDGDDHQIESGATDEPGLRAWLRDLPEESEGPLADGELDRARDWGRKLAMAYAESVGRIPSR